jgi:type IV secretion system protein VirB1
MLALDLNPYFDACAPDVGRTTLAAIVRVESKGRPYAMLDNGPAHLPYPERLKFARSYSFSTKDEAVAKAKTLLAQGRLLDMGLMQVNSRNMTRMGYSVEAMFDPCTNIRVGAHILKDNYVRAVKVYGEGQKALQHALSAYNTGSLWGGAGYVKKVLAAAGAKAPMQMASAPASGTIYSPGKAAKPAQYQMASASPHRATAVVQWGAAVPFGTTN